jgi:DNA-binding protein HU-beta
MNKAKLIEAMAKATKQSKTVCKEMLEAMLDIISGALKRGDDVGVTGFGTFSVIKRKSRAGINPVTRAKMTIAAKKVPKFKPGKALKALVK